MLATPVAVPCARLEDACVLGPRPARGMATRGRKVSWPIGRPTTGPETDLPLGLPLNEKIPETLLWNGRRGVDSGSGRILLPRGVEATLIAVDRDRPAWAEFCAGVADGRTWDGLDFTSMGFGALPIDWTSIFSSQGGIWPGSIGS